MSLFRVAPGKDDVDALLLFDSFLLTKCTSTSVPFQNLYTGPDSKLEKNALIEVQHNIQFDHGLSSKKKSLEIAHLLL